ncbi:hypothetical protein AMECASPLE_035573 [Ameca splendens]|uniref:Uncharacterized protein n=1 Tax=Ameca splendens TaxID=208324 RepID=A0ABV0XWM5_9TELE
MPGHPLDVLHLLELAMVECGRAKTYLKNKPTSKDVQIVFPQDEDSELALHVVQLLMPPIKLSTDGPILHADIFFIGINLERGNKSTLGKIISKKKGKVIQKTAVTVNSNLPTLLKNIIDS